MNDERLAPYRDLPRANMTALSGRFIVEGKLMVDRLVASHYLVESVVVASNRLAMLPPSLPDQVPVFVLPASSLESLIGFNFHRGILACGLRGSVLRLPELVASCSPAALYVVCVDVQDPTNLGGILRNCAAFGADGVLLCGHCADAFSRRVLRVSMGTAFKLHIAISQNGLPDVCRLRDDYSIELVATVLDDAAEKLEAARRAPRMALVIGNEGQGLAPEWVAACQRRVTLPMTGGTDSLNVSAASAVFLYHFQRVAYAVSPAP